MNDIIEQQNCLWFEKLCCDVVLSLSVPLAPDHQSTFKGKLSQILLFQQLFHISKHSTFLFTTLTPETAPLSCALQSPYFDKVAGVTVNIAAKWLAK